MPNARHQVGAKRFLIPGVRQSSYRMGGGAFRSLQYDVALLRTCHPLLSSATGGVVSF